MSVENVVNLYKLQELVSAESKLSSAEDALTLLKRALEDAKCKLMNAESFSEQDKADFNKAYESLEGVSYYIVNLDKTAGKSKRRLAAKLEQELGVEEE